MIKIPKTKPTLSPKLIVLLIIAGLFVTACCPANDSAPEEIPLRYEDNISLTYPELIEAYQALDRKYAQARLLTYGPTDFGKPLHLFIISATGEFDPAQLHEKGFRIVMVNNGIHPGEPCGIDASVKLARDLLTDENGLWALMDSTVLCIVPVYNIGGMHNRSAFNRANQNGPVEQGFRANARNLDLNRDYVAMNSRNAQSFAQIFHKWKPHLLIDTHTTNGADYQYVMTLIPNHPQELPPMLGSFYAEIMEPYLYEEMEQGGFEMIPYVSPMGSTPESGLQQYYNTPRYTTGFGRMFNTISFMTEAHMFKPFSDRVLSTYEFIRVCLSFVDEQGMELAKRRNEADAYVKEQTSFVLRWELDTTIVEHIPFKGYEAEWIDSEITGAKRIRYDRSRPFTRPVPYYRAYNSTLTVRAPEYYIIPQAWHEVIHRLRINGVVINRFEKDTLLSVEAYYIEDYKSRNRPYNGHFLHYDISLRTENQQLQFYEGDYYIKMDQEANAFIIEVLEPLAADAYFSWNFFDAVLQRKEYFSSYIFEDYALEMLKQDEQLQKDFVLRKQTDKNFAANSWAQLNWLYERSPYFEKSFMRYPVYRLGKKE